MKKIIIVDGKDCMMATWDDGTYPTLAEIAVYFKKSSKHAVTYPIKIVEDEYGRFGENEEVDYSGCDYKLEDRLAEETGWPRKLIRRIKAGAHPGGNCDWIRFDGGTAFNFFDENCFDTQEEYEELIGIEIK